MCCVCVCVVSPLADLGVITTTKSSDLLSEVASLQKIVNFLENIDQKEQVAKSNEAFVDRLDKICFCFFLFIDIIYVIIVIIVTNTGICKETKRNIWDNEDLLDDHENYTYYSSYYYY